MIYGTLKMRYRYLLTPGTFTTRFCNSMYHIDARCQNVNEYLFDMYNYRELSIQLINTLAWRAMLCYRWTKNKTLLNFCRI